MIKALIFDMDGTLYASAVIRAQFAEAACHTLADIASLDRDVARQTLEAKRQDLRKQYGESVPYTLTLLALGISIEVWHEYNIAYFDPRDHLDQDPALRSSLEELKEKYTLAVLTNNNQIQTDRTLEALGIRGLFDRVFTYNTFRILKPEPAFFVRAARCLRIPVEACCFIGDRYDVDLKPAKKVGMAILQVSGPKDIYDLQQRFEQGDYLS